MKELRMNYLAMAICVALMQLIPMVWYGMIFRTSWMDLNHLTPDFLEAHKAEAPMAYTAGVMQAVFGVYMLARLFISMRVETPMRGFLNGASLGFAFIVMPLMCVNLFSYRPYPLSWIDGGHFTLGLAVAGLVLGSWRKYKN